MTTNSPRSEPIGRGKGKATVSEPTREDFNDLNPVITYRHILSSNLGVRDPLRVIALCDSDAFYAACEMNRLGVGKDLPLVVMQWDMLLAVNYPARKYGISRLDQKNDALKKCPHLKIVHVPTYKEGKTEPGYWGDVARNTHKISLDYYRRESMKIAAMFKEELRGCEVEKASIDEAFFDFTKPVREIMLQRYPYLAHIPASAPAGADTPLPPPMPISWNGLGNLIPDDPLQPPEDELQEGQPNPNGSAPQSPQLVSPGGKNGLKDIETPITWHDVALSIAAELMGKAREVVRVKLGYTTSAGIARNKFLAKLTASYKKLDTQSILRNAAIPNYLRPMQFQKIRFLGGKLGDAIAKEYDVSTIGALFSLKADQILEELQYKFGDNSVWIYDALRGIDRSEVKDKGSTLTKDMVSFKTLTRPITKPSEGKRWIRILAAELHLRLNDALEISPNLRPKTISLHARGGNEGKRSKQCPFPTAKEVTIEMIASAGDKLWKELVGNSTILSVSGIRLAFTGIDISEAGQRSIEGFLNPTSSSISTGLQSPSVFPHRKEPAPQEGSKAIQTHHTQDLHDNPPPLGSLSYSCFRCGKAFELPTVSDDAQGVRDQLARAKLEHSDFHFAQDLAKQANPRPVITSSNNPTTRTRTNKRSRASPEPKGIEKFFGK
ncbi:hypothetical protein GALMADRAFT_228261 [Galerina marginata CBS 339.88]|uniref:DNA polymerase eta n=1 Tax=Galerina marginata (strain CBS 339.88) TaxID=685588 RepID=A0A067SQ93_GALM3|nr:hypothetical protein GALMADRAFT_228261 [Galerina marginata CBS 339.88]